ncbi:hypothetical protein QEJ31_10905 [Pigmentibacter sp. JX0631]|uniref:hypothetical protein n=1 Tax=Pigmentibacter sp. JX0631 TaxID=2976982 RepID=UPI002468D8B2|nr:hypothetical protein [Pigmentibacter sp. JX0631]WGL59027.1 hypothetical protein QEJ31_10905 [Pigmentibacter sp. JX0631]
MYKKSVKLTAIGLGLVSFALVSCKSKNDNKNNESANPNPVEKTTENKNMEKLEVSFSSKSLSLKGGCAVVNVNYTDAKGNKSPNLAAFNDNNFSISLVGASSKYFELKDGELCTVAADKDGKKITNNGEKATIVAKFNNLFASNTLVAVKDTFNAINTSLTTDQVKASGEKISFSIKGFSNSSVSNDDLNALNTLTDTNYTIEVIDTVSSVVIANAVTFNAKTKVWELNTKVLGYQADPTKNTENEKLLKIKATSKNNTSEFYEVNLAKITITAPVVKSVKFENVKSNFLKDSTNKLNFVAVYSDDSVKPIAHTNITFVVKDDSETVPTDVTVENGNLIIKNTAQDSVASGKYYKLKATAGSNIIQTNNFHEVIFVVGENAPEVQFNFRELGLTGQFNSVNDTLTAKTLAKGASESDINFIKLDQDYAKNNCVKVLPRLKIGTTVLENLIPFDDSKLIKSDSDKFTSNFSITKDVICAQKAADLNTKLVLNYKFQGIVSNPLTVTVGDAILTSKVSAGVAGKSIVEFKDLTKKEEVYVKAYYTYTDGKISNQEASTADAAKFNFTLSNTNSPFKLAINGSNWVLSHNANISTQYKDQVNEVSITAKVPLNNGQVANGDKLVVKFAD